MEKAYQQGIFIRKHEKNEEIEFSQSRINGFLHKVALNSYKFSVIFLRYSSGRGVSDGDFTVFMT